MAALADPARHLPAPELRDLRGLRASDLHDLLEEEIRVWREELDWDFEKSAALVRKFVEARALNGSVLVSGGDVIGYSYYVVEDQKGLIGDLFVRRAFQTTELEQTLLNATVDDLMKNPLVTRIESQLMLLRAPLGSPHRAGLEFRRYPREFLIFEAREAAQLAARRLSSSVEVTPWKEVFQDPGAHLISETYKGHVDSFINDQYRNAGCARRFLYNIVQYPGCGAFCEAASFAAFSGRTGELCGMSLASEVGDASGHITQVCVSPKWQGQGLGYELLRRSMVALNGAGCAKISLTVTSENDRALRLYRTMGFRSSRRFAAYVWEV